MRGSTIDQVRHDIDPAHTDKKVSEQIDEAEKAAGLQSMSAGAGRGVGQRTVVRHRRRHFRRGHRRGGRRHLSVNRASRPTP